jgi:cell division protease FtsH
VDCDASRRPLVEGETAPSSEAKWKPFVAFRPDDQGLIQALEQSGIEFAVEPARGLSPVLIAIFSSGAQDDLDAATSLARQMVCVLGMSERIGLQRCARPGEGAFLGNPFAMQRDCSEATAREPDREVRALLETARDEARAILETRRPALELVSRVLV